MSYVIPVAELEVADVQAIKSQVIETLLSIAERQTGMPRDQLIVRDALPKTDFGLTNEVWVTPSLTANDWTNYFTQQLEEQRFVAFYGVANLAADPIATGLKFKVGSGNGTKVLDVVQLEGLYANTERVEGLLKKPLIYKERQYVNIDVYAKAAGTEPLVLKAVVVEPAGKVTF